MNKPKIQSREEWLFEMAQVVNKDLFKQPLLNKLGIKKKFNIKDLQFSMAFPPNKRINGQVVNGKLHRAKKTSNIIGQCWAGYSISDKEKMKTQILITPDLTDTTKIVGVLIHELIHYLTPAEGHRGKFKTLALAVGLEGKMTATTESKELVEKIDKMVKKIGKIPHTKWLPVKRRVQTTIMIKLSCQAVDHTYIVRTSRKNIVEHGAPFCPECCNTMFSDDPELNDYIARHIERQYYKFERKEVANG